MTDYIMGADMGYRDGTEIAVIEAETKTLVFWALERDLSISEIFRKLHLMHEHFKFRHIWIDNAYQLTHDYGGIEFLHEDALKGLPIRQLKVSRKEREIMIDKLSLAMANHDLKIADGLYFRREHKAIDMAWRGIEHKVAYTKVSMP